MHVQIESRSNSYAYTSTCAHSDRKKYILANSLSFSGGGQKYAKISHMSGHAQDVQYGRPTLKGERGACGTW